MKYGAGDVARIIANKPIELGHEVMIGSRSESNLSSALWTS